MSDIFLQDLSKVKKAGFLNKMGGTVKSWKRRYFILHEMSLDYYKDECLQGKEKLGTIPIVDCTVTCEPSGEQPGFYFMLKLPSNSAAKRPEFLMCAETEADRRSWINAIDKVNIVTVFNNEFSAALQVNPKRPGCYLPVPFFMVKALKFIEENAIDMEGIYRLNGSAQKIDNMVTAINANVNVEFSDPHSTTGLIKQYMRNLKTPILMYENIPKLKEIVNAPEEQQVSMLHNLLRSLPIPNFVFLSIFIQHFIKISQHSDKNLMKNQAIMVCIGPSLIWSEDNKDAIYDANIQQIISALMLENYQKLFTNNPLMIYTAKATSSFNTVVEEQDTIWPFTLDVPVGEVVQTVAEDRYGWTICVYNDKWGCVHRKDLEPVKSNQQLLKGIAGQTNKWNLSPEDLSNIGAQCPDAVQLYEVLLQRVKALREKAARV